MHVARFVPCSKKYLCCLTFYSRLCFWIRILRLLFKKSYYSINWWVVKSELLCVLFYKLFQFPVNLCQELFRHALNLLVNLGGLTLCLNFSQQKKYVCYMCFFVSNWVGHWIPDLTFYNNFMFLNKSFCEKICSIELQFLFIKQKFSLIFCIWKCNWFIVFLSFIGFLG
jgi:hypothetical protein